jgi:hypothetical protein
MSGFRDKQRTLVNTVSVPGDEGSSPGKSRGDMPKYDPTTKLIILCRSPETSLWDSCGLNLHTNTEINYKKYKGKVPVHKSKNKIKSFEQGNYPPPLPTGIGERFSQTISNLYVEHAALLRRCELPEVLY